MKLLKFIKNVQTYFKISSRSKTLLETDQNLDLESQIEEKKIERAELRRLNEELSAKIGDQDTAIDLRNKYKVSLQIEE